MLTTQVLFSHLRMTREAIFKKEASPPHIRSVFICPHWDNHTVKTQSIAHRPSVCLMAVLCMCAHGGWGLYTGMCETVCERLYVWDCMCERQRMREIFDICKWVLLGLASGCTEMKLWFSANKYRHTNTHLKCPLRNTANAIHTQHCAKA